MATVFTAPILPRAPAARPTLVPTGFPIAVRAPHGNVTVTARYSANDDSWSYTFPSKSHPGELHTVSNRCCNCPSYKTCWHLKAVASVQSKLQAIIRICLADLGWDGSVEDAYYSQQTLAGMGITVESATQAMTALEALS